MIIEEEIMFELANKKKKLTQIEREINEKYAHALNLSTRIAEQEKECMLTEQRLQKLQEKLHPLLDFQSLHEEKLLLERSNQILKGENADLANKLYQKSLAKSIFKPHRLYIEADSAEEAYMQIVSKLTKFALRNGLDPVLYKEIMFQVNSEWMKMYLECKQSKNEDQYEILLDSFIALKMI